MIKLVAADMDGTLLDDEKRLPPDFKEWVLTHPDIKVVIASGRQYKTLQDNMGVIAEHLFYICENGAVAYADDKLIHSDVIDTKEVLQALDILKDFPKATPMLCCADCCITERLPKKIRNQRDMYYHSAEGVDGLYQAAKDNDVCKIAIYCEDESAGQIYERLNLPSKNIKTTLSGCDWIDIANVSVNKGHGMRKIQESLGITPAECIAFGDYLNDVELLQACDHSYAMENAHADLKKIAKHIAPSNNDNGVMQILHTL